MSVEHKFVDGTDEGIWVGGHPLIINGYGVFGKDAEAITALIQEARIEELKRVGCCDYWEDGCDLNVCNGEQLDRIKQLSGGSNNDL